MAGITGIGIHAGDIKNMQETLKVLMDRNEKELFRNSTVIWEPRVNIFRKTLVSIMGNKAEKVKPQKCGERVTMKKVISLVMIVALAF